jgi:hypothetical protein
VHIMRAKIIIFICALNLLLGLVRAAPTPGDFKGKT